MSLQQDRFRVILLISRPNDESPTQFQHAIEERMKELDAIPMVQRNRLNREVCFSIGDSGDVVQAANISGSLFAYDAIVIEDFKSREAWAEARRDPEAIKLDLQEALHGLPGDYDG
ncbi:hypothetical protein DFH09DRAFT_1272904 [Mycena vulgaris]|nr:hypothetical protein DFH09DRAFT_1272904 [Mycena vulgaris]